MIFISRRSSLALPYMFLLTALTLLLQHSIGPFDMLYLMAFFIAVMSLLSSFANEAMCWYCDPEYFSIHAFN